MQTFTFEKHLGYNIYFLESALFLPSFDGHFSFPSVLEGSKEQRSFFDMIFRQTITLWHYLYEKKVNKLFGYPMGLAKVKSQDSYWNKKA